MPEVAHSGEDHRQSRLVRGGNHFFVADRAAGLDHRRGAGLHRGEEAVGEGEEGVGGDRRAARLRLVPAGALGGVVSGTEMLVFMSPRIWGAVSGWL